MAVLMHWRPHNIIILYTTYTDGLKPFVSRYCLWKYYDLVLSKIIMIIMIQYWEFDNNNNNKSKTRFGNVNQRVGLIELNHQQGQQLDDNAPKINPSKRARRASQSPKLQEHNLTIDFERKDFFISSINFYLSVVVLWPFSKIEAKVVLNRCFFEAYG